MTGKKRGSHKRVPQKPGPVTNRKAGPLNFKAMSKPYWEQRRDMKLKGRKTADEEKSESKSKSEFFQRMLAAAPKKCMETGRPLSRTMAINPMAVVCHILPKSKKSGVPSMAENPLNIVYLDGDVHTDMDNQGCDFMQKMKIYPLLRRRVVLMWDHIPDHEKRRVPECLAPSYGLEEIAAGK